MSSPDLLALLFALAGSINCLALSLLIFDATLNQLTTEETS